MTLFNQMHLIDCGTAPGHLVVLYIMEKRTNLQIRFFNKYLVANPSFCVLTFPKRFMQTFWSFKVWFTPNSMVYLILFILFLQVWKNIFLFACYWRLHNNIHLFVTLSVYISRAFTPKHSHVLCEGVSVCQILYKRLFYISYIQ